MLVVDVLVVGWIVEEPDIPVDVDLVALESM